MELPQWQGGDPTGQIFRGEFAFSFVRLYRTPEAPKVDNASTQIDEDILQWYDWFKIDNGILTWEHFKNE